MRAPALALLLALCLALPAPASVVIRGSGGGGGGGPVPVVESSDEDGSNGTPGALTPIVPSGDAGDLLLALFSQEQNSDSSGQDVSPDSGTWTEILSDPGGPVDPTLYATYHVYTGSEPATYDFSSESEQDVQSITVRISGQNASTPINGTPAFSSGTSATPTAPSITTTTDGCLIIRFAGVRATGGASFSATPGTLIQTANEAVALLSVSSESQASSGATGTAGWTLTASKAWVAGTFAVCS